ncbi:3-hydroxybutyryl-CoA dehydratase-like [Hibiscus syriacus]|uniref:3-hydroxybutyryl-CoA dehydratase-like n=1 Tax=Hibiscus syriacus TaxID=106335 RepID=A0A6A3AF41_HIBSY|nr:probable protein phosphatase 2C 42 [Hibiscus syriacus]KAE8702746.1 3-hydroxybutyryl-CoA dehydratase-like [Hibiscus syriacus]
MPWGITNHGEKGEEVKADYSSCACLQKNDGYNALFTTGGLIGSGSSGGSREVRDGFFWFRDIGKYGSGEFSVAVIQANQVLEDQSQIESGQFDTFVGIYDGHGGPEATCYVCDHLFNNFRAMVAESGEVMTAETIQRAFQQTEEGFTALVSELWNTRPNMATVGLTII